MAEAPRKRYPDFVCIGAQKAGTTWLHACLAAHPSVFEAAFKELHYFDSLHIERFADFFAKGVQRHERQGISIPEKLRFAAAQAGVTLDDDWYAALFAGARADQICIDITPSYALLPRAGIEHLLRLSPDARVLYIVRDPVERSFSQLRMRLERERGDDQARMLKLATQRMNLRRSNYPRSIDRWSAMLPPARFKVVFYEEISARPFELLEEICSFAQLPYRAEYFASATRLVNQGVARPMPERVRAVLVRELEGVLREMAARYPAQAGGWLAKYGLTP
jgi:Sulfotransferase family